LEKTENSQSGDFEHQKGACLIGYSDHIRMFSEENLRLQNVKKNENNEPVSQSVIEMDKEGNITLQTGSGEEAAKIILKADGNIIIKPGKNGLVHLGGDESDTTLSVCGVPTTKGEGSATPDPITTSMGGQLFRGANPDIETTIDIRATINAVAVAAGPSLNLAAAGSALPAAQLVPNVPGVASSDGTASSKVVLKG
jgi:hypothetical protein